LSDVKLPWKLLSVDQLRSKPGTTVFIWIYSQTLESIETWSVVGIHNVLFSTFFSLGARHDGQNNLNNCSSSERYVMAPSVGATTSEKGTNHYIFSNCSVDYFQTYIDYMDQDE